MAEAPRPEARLRLVARSHAIVWVALASSFLFGVILALCQPRGIFMAFPAGIAVELFLRQDLGWLAAECLLLPLAWRLAKQSRQVVPARLVSGVSRHGVWLVTSAFVLTASVGVVSVYHAYALSLDEFLARFQALAIRQGSPLARLPPEWSPWAPALQPIFMYYLQGTRAWVPGYLPGNGALLAGFDVVHALPWAHVALAGASLPAMGLLARRVFPDRPWAPFLACFLLASSAQVWITAMTSYAMTPHLLLTILWLLAFLRGDRLGHAGAMALGAIGIGLHQLYVHPVLALPFLLALYRDGRRLLAISYVAWYAVCCRLWSAWVQLAFLWQQAGQGATVPHAPGLGVVQSATHLLSRHSAFDLLVWPVNIGRFLSWQGLVLLPLLGAGFLSLRNAPRVVRCGAWSIALLLLVHALLMPGPGHGWGYRYLHPALGLVSLVAVHGCVRLWGSGFAHQRAVGCRLLAVLGLCSIGGLILRATQVERFVGPFADASAYIANSPAEVVVVDDAPIWFGSDLVRNHPTLSRLPIVLSGRKLRPAHLTDLCRRHRIEIVDLSQLEPLGIEAMPSSPRPRLRDVARSVGCRLVSR